MILSDTRFVSGGILFVTLHASEAAVQCIVTAPFCLFVCGSVTTITRNCVHQSPPN